MEPFFSIFLFLLLYLLLALSRDQVPSEFDNTYLSRQAEQYTAKHEYAKAEETLWRLVQLTERQEGKASAVTQNRVFRTFGEM